jgi:hypothetical protein
VEDSATVVDQMMRQQQQQQQQQQPWSRRPGGLARTTTTTRTLLLALLLLLCCVLLCTRTTTTLIEAITIRNAEADIKVEVGTRVLGLVVTHEHVATACRNNDRLYELGLLAPGHVFVMGRAEAVAATATEGDAPPSSSSSSSCVFEFDARTTANGTASLGVLNFVQPAALAGLEHGDAVHWTGAFARYEDIAKAAHKAGRIAAGGYDILTNNCGVAVRFGRVFFLLFFLLFLLFVGAAATDTHTTTTSYVRTYASKCTLY